MYQNNYGILLNIVQSFKNDVHVHVVMLLYVSSAKGHLSVENEKHFEDSVDNSPQNHWIFC